MMHNKSNNHADDLMIQAWTVQVTPIWWVRERTTADGRAKISGGHDEDDDDYDDDDDDDDVILVNLVI